MWDFFFLKTACIRIWSKNTKNLLNSWLFFTQSLKEVFLFWIVFKRDTQSRFTLFRVFVFLEVLRLLLNLYLNLIFRYFLNTLISLAILQVLYHKKAYLKLALVFYSISLVCLLIAFSIAINFTDFKDYQYLFYIRRFLIQPLLLLLLIPAFYYQKKFAWFLKF